MNEYELLRAEILSDLESIKQYQNILFTVVPAILAFTFNSEKYWACMLPYIVIASIFFMESSKNKAICKVGTYLNVFLEGGTGEKSHNWERRHKQFDEIYLSVRVKTYNKYTLKYYLHSFSCSGITLIKLYGSKEDTLIKCSDALVITAITLGIVLIISSFEFSYTKERPIMIGAWEKIKNKRSEEEVLSPVSINDLREMSDEETKKEERRKLINRIGVIFAVFCIIAAVCLRIVWFGNSNKKDDAREYATEFQSEIDTSQAAIEEPLSNTTQIPSQDAMETQD